jgi:hypothetical protein
VLAVPLRIPWTLAGETAALDNLSGGRLILGMGTGATWMGWQHFANVPKDARTRAEMLDETIDLLTEMYQRRPFVHQGKHYQLDFSELDVRHYPPKPAQQPRPPLWVVGAWPRMKSMERILKCDGLLPMKMNAQNQFEEVTPADLAEMKAYVDAGRELPSPFDYVIEGKTAGLSSGEVGEKLGSWQSAGATWWIESTWGMAVEDLEVLIKHGPPGMY